MRTRSVFSHTAQALLEGALVALIVVGLVAGSALAARSGGGGKGGGGHTKPGTGTGTLAVVMVDDQNHDGAPNHGDTITFNVTSSTTSPYVSVTCKQGGTLVYSASAGFYADFPWPGARNMPLSSPSWGSGAADCTAVIENTTAKLSFHVNA